MFFFLSKTVGFLTKPFIWIFIFLLIAVFSRKPKRKQRCIILTLAILFIFSNSFLLNVALKNWETPPVNVETIVEPYDIGIVLGGFSSYIQKYDILRLNAAGDRIWQAIYLYKTGKIKKILISGGTITEGRRPESDAAREILITIGIPDSVIMIDARSRNTHENALYSNELIEQVQPGARCLLITSATHMPRALACFRKVGMNPDIFPVEHLTSFQKSRWYEWIIPQIEAFSGWDKVINEWMGMLAYKVRGYV